MWWDLSVQTLGIKEPSSTFVGQKIFSAAESRSREAQDLLGFPWSSDKNTSSGAYTHFN